MDAFLQCAGCKKILFALEFEQALRVCGHCGYHHRLTSRQRIDITFDEGSFSELDADFRSGNPLDFPEYREKLESAERSSGRTDAVLSGVARLDGADVSLAATEFAFMGGSMGSVAGEKITRVFERALERETPAIVFCASGGARMQEGLLSLMQMPKTVAAAGRLRRARLPYLAVFTDPTMAGVLASYASVADVILSEPKALVGFAGTRVAKQAQVTKVPDDFQTSEFAQRSGFVDKILVRREVRPTLSQLVKVFMEGRRGG